MGYDGTVWLGWSGGGVEGDLLAGEVFELALLHLAISAFDGLHWDT
jgi:hypothetical protein